MERQALAMMRRRLPDNRICSIPKETVFSHHMNFQPEIFCNFSADIKKKREPKFPFFLIPAVCWISVQTRTFQYRTKFAEARTQFIEAFLLLLRCQLRIVQVRTQQAEQGQIGNRF